MQSVGTKKTSYTNDAKLAIITAQTLIPKPKACKGIEGTMKFYTEHLERTGDPLTIAQLLRQLACDLLRKPSQKISPEFLSSTGDKFEIAAHKSRLKPNGGTELPPCGIACRPKRHKKSKAKIQKGGTELP